MANVSNGTIFRVPRHENFTVMSNYHLRDANLSWKARGLLSTILSFPPNWDYTVEGLAACAKDNLSSTKSGVIELEENGYLYRIQKRKTDGTWAKMEYQVYENPDDNPYFTNKTKSEMTTDKKVKDAPNITLKQKPFENNADTALHPIVDFPPTDNPPTDNPLTEKPIAENRTQLNTYRIKDLSNQELTQSIHPEAAESPGDGWMDRAASLPESLVETLGALGYDDGYGRGSDQELLDEIRTIGLRNEALKACRIPYSFAQSKPVTEKALRLIACYERYREDDPFDPMIGILSALASMATTESAQYNKRTVRAAQVIDKINERIAAEGCLMDWLDSFQTRWEEILEERRSSITHLSAYLKSCLWKWLEDSDAETLANIPAV